MKLELRREKEKKEDNLKVDGLLEEQGKEEGCRYDQHTTYSYMEISQRNPLTCILCTKHIYI